MTGTEPAGVTVRAVLFGEGEIETELNRSLRDSGSIETVAAALGKLPKAIGDAALERLGHVVAKLLDLDVLDVIMLGWQEHHALQEAARRTLQEPGAEEVVRLATHRMGSKYEPRVEVIVDDAHVATVHLEIDLSLELHAVNAVISSGRLAALTSGDADVAAKLSCEGVLVRSESRQIDLHLTFPLKEGIQLVDPTKAAPVAPDQPATSGG
jgi:hypothetical protein